MAIVRSKIDHIMKFVKVLLICFLSVVICALCLLYFMFRPTDGRKIKEITEETYKELQETDTMYAELPYGAQVTEIYVEQLLGDANVDVYVTVPEENVDDFALWLNNAGKQYNNKKNVFYFRYFVGDSHTHFGEYEE